MRPEDLHHPLLARVDGLVAELPPGASRLGKKYRVGSVKGKRDSS